MSRASLRRTNSKSDRAGGSAGATCHFYPLW